MVLGPKPTWKLTTPKKNLNTRQNQGIVWSSDPNLWGNYLLLRKTTRQNQGIAWSSDPNIWGNKLLPRKTKVLDRIKVLHDPQT